MSFVTAGSAIGSQSKESQGTKYADMLFVAMMRAHVLADQNRVNVEKTFLRLSYLTTAASPVISALPHRWFGCVQAYVLLYIARSRPGASTIGYLSEMLQLRSVHVHQVLRILLRKGYLAQTYASGISAGPPLDTDAGRTRTPSKAPYRDKALWFAWPNIYKKSRGMR